MAAPVVCLSKEQADRASAALLAEPVAGQRAEREAIDRQRDPKPRGWALGLWMAILALIGFKS
jgi:hypothetical protein